MRETPKLGSEPTADKGVPYVHTMNGISTNPHADCGERRVGAGRSDSWELALVGEAGFQRLRMEMNIASSSIGGRRMRTSALLSNGFARASCTSRKGTEKIYYMYYLRHDSQDATVSGSSQESL